MWLLYTDCLHKVISPSHVFEVLYEVLDRQIGFQICVANAYTKNGQTVFPVLAVNRLQHRKMQADGILLEVKKKTQCYICEVVSYVTSQLKFYAFIIFVEGVSKLFHM